MENESNIQIGRRVAQARLRQGLSQGGLAERSKISPRTISDLELGKRWPQLHSRMSVSEALGEHPLFLDALKEGVSPSNVSPKSVSGGGPSLAEATDAQLLAEIARRFAAAGELTL